MNFVAREDELSVLQAAPDDAQAARGTMLLLVGEPVSERHLAAHVEAVADPERLDAPVAVSPADPNLVVVAGDRSLHRSRDGGDSWDTATGDVNGIFCGTISDVAVDPGDPDRIYIGAHRSGLWRSSDGGDHWTKLTLPELADEDAISPKLDLRRRRGSGQNLIPILEERSLQFFK